jgi:hypothetical protein
MSEYCVPDTRKRIQTLYTHLIVWISYWTAINVYKIVSNHLLSLIPMAKLLASDTINYWKEKKLIAVIHYSTIFYQLLTDNSLP